MEPDLIRRLATPAATKVVLCVMDGLGGLPGPRGRTELEEADSPQLDRLAELGAVGQSIPVGIGITPGSGPGHLALFGLDPLRHEVGRGALEATGIELELGPLDLAARGNLCTVDGDGRIVDRRAGRVATEVTADIAGVLSAVELPGVELTVRPVREHRFVLVLRGEGLSAAITETDPQQVGVAPLAAEPLPDAVDGVRPDAARTAELVNGFVARARRLLEPREPANGLTLRGWATRPELPQLPALWRLRAAAVATYPMYRGLARLVGMDVLDAGETIDTQLAALGRHWEQYDFFFLHWKHTDSAGEDGDFTRKMRAIEAFDRALPRVLALEPDVLVVTGDHSTPATMAAHSWHPVPLLISGRHVRVDHSHGFGEGECARGGLGTIPAREVLPLAFAHAGRLAKYGA
ncbi:MAG: 2,3-bisphosphoglycerate-independent phosphoglycerate mutase [Chloroflexi bacterium]|nr:2,3-bisphosphoglycerate-independent phosphoglycerate mutase [Chloroflexota bacterium]